MSFHCYLHSWSHIQNACPLCPPPITGTSSNSVTVPNWGELPKYKSTEEEGRIDALEAKCAELQALVKGHEFTIAHQKAENGWQADLLQRAKKLNDDGQCECSGYGPRGCEGCPSCDWLADYEKGPSDES